LAVVQQATEGKRMSSKADIFLKAALVGVGGTIVLDLYALLMSRVLSVPATNWAMLGRWFGNMTHGQFVQIAMSEAAPVMGELEIFRLVTLGQSTSVMGH